MNPNQPNLSQINSIPTQNKPKPNQIKSKNSPRYWSIFKPLNQPETKPNQKQHRILERLTNDCENATEQSSPLKRSGAGSAVHLLTLLKKKSVTGRRNTKTGSTIIT